MDYEILATGSNANCTIINNKIAVDMGTYFKKVDPYLKKLQLILLTHIHSDHFKKPTIYQIAKQRPRIRFGCGSWLVPYLLDCGVKAKNIDIYKMDRQYDYGLFKIIPFALNHNVLNCGYKIFMNDKKIIYATDTNDLNGVYAPDFDLYLIEANYTEDGIQERIQAKLETGEYIYEYGVMQNHLSKEKADKWLMENMGDKSEYEYMHGHIEKDNFVMNGDEKH